MKGTEQTDGHAQFYIQLCQSVSLWFFFPSPFDMSPISVSVSLSLSLSLCLSLSVSLSVSLSLAGRSSAFWNNEGYSQGYIECKIVHVNPWPRSEYGARVGRGLKADEDEETKQIVKAIHELKERMTVESAELTRLKDEKKRHQVKQCVRAR